MKAVKCLVIFLALAYCVDGRERLGKIIKRQARHREDKALQGPQAGFIDQSVVRNSFAHPQSAPTGSQPRAAEINVPLIPYQQGQQQLAQPSYPTPQNPQVQYQQPITSAAAQPPYAAPQNPQVQYQQPITSAAAQPPYAAPQNSLNQYQPIPSQAVPPSFAAQPIAQNQYQSIPSPQVQQEQQASYQEISLLQALESPQYTQAVRQAYQTSPSWAQPIEMRDPSNKILLRLPSNATLIRRNIVDTFSCLGKPYGYYADVANECQIFHVCFPLRAVFNNNPEVPDVTYEYSFICNEFTRFSQDALTCAFTYEALPCAQAELMYSINDHFFKITTPAPKPGVYPSGIAGPLPGSVQVTGIGGFQGNYLP